AHSISCPVYVTVSTSSSPTGGGATVGGGTVTAGSSVTVRATPNTGYSFANWTENGTVISTSASYTFTVSANRNLIANFATTAPSGPWAKGFGGSSYNYGQAVAVETNTGNIVLVGTFGGATDFGGGLLTSVGGQDMVLAKYSPAGTQL